MKRLVSAVALSLIRAYQRWISPAFPRRCKYEPTCSAYATQAVRELGPLRGGILAAWRLLRCNPLSDGGIDDVADRRLFRGHRRYGHGPQAPRRGAATAGADPGSPQRTAGAGT